MAAISILFLIYGILLALIVTACIIIYRVLSKHSKLLAFAVSLFMLSVLSLFWPIPTHGGVTFVYQVIYQEWKFAKTIRSNRITQDDRQKSLAHLDTRFRGPVEFEVIAALSPGWKEVTLTDGKKAWFDTKSKLFWSEWLLLETSDALPPLEIALERCRDYPPVGYWALSTEAENILLWQSNGEEILPATEASSVSYSVEEFTQLKIPTYILRNSNSNSNSDNDLPGNDRPAFVVRCVARSHAAPPVGYSKQDIPLEQWNRYQLSKLKN